MAYIGKYIDRNPNIRAAGVTTVLGEKASDHLRIYSDEEVAENLLQLKCLHQTAAQRDHYFTQHQYIPKGTISDVLYPELKKSRFVAFREKFLEDMYFKKHELGKVYPLKSKPDHITNENTTFGELSSPSEDLYDIVLPRKTPDQVNRDYFAWHDKYILSHKHYFPSEQIQRNYPKPFDKNNKFGVKSNVDFSGRHVRNAMIQCDKSVVISRSQKEYLERAFGRLAKNTNRRIPHITPDTLFGVTFAADECKVKDLIENMDTCERSNPLVDAIGHINKIRQLLFKRVDFHVADLKSVLENLDTKNTGYLTLRQIFDTLRREQFFINEEKMKTAFRHFKMIVDEGLNTERVNYDDVWKLLNMRMPLPKTANVTKLPPNIYNKDTTYRFMCSDLSKTPVELVLIKPSRLIEAEPTTVKDVVTPEIPMQLGLGQSDFAKPRSKEELRKIFKQILCDDFDAIWTLAQKESKYSDELLSVDELRQAMNDNREMLTQNKQITNANMQ